LGNFYYRQKEFSKAVEAFLGGLDIEPTSLPLLSGLGFSYLMNGELFESESTFKQIQNLDPEYAESYVGLGAIAQKDGHLERAESLYEKALALDPQNFEAHFYLSKLRMEQGRYQEAERLLKTIRSSSPDALWLDSYILQAVQGPLYEEINLRRKEGNLKEVERLYRELIRNSDYSKDAYLEMGSFFLETNQPRKAEELYLEALKRYPLSDQLMTNLGFALLKRGKIKESRLIFTQLLALSPDNSEALSGLGLIELRSKNFKQAERDLKRALAIQPTSISALSALGLLYSETGQDEKAKVIYERLFNLLPDQPWVRIAMEEARFAPLLNQIKELENTPIPRENLLKAEKLYTKLLTLAPDNPNFYLRYGLLLTNLGRLSQAERVLKQGLSQESGYLPLQIALAFNALFQENYPSAAAQFEKIREKHPQNADVLAGLGRIAEFQKRTAEAQDFYNQALLQDPDNINALSFQAGLKLQSQQLEEAKALYERLEELEPNKEWIRSALQEITLAPELERAEELIQTGELERAAEIYRTVISTQTPSLEAILRLGNLYIRMNQYPQAAETFLDGLRSFPDTPRLLTAAGLAFALADNPEKAEPLFKRALEQTPNDPGALAGLGKVAFLQGNNRKAEGLYLQALTLSPDNSPALSFYGELLVKEKRYDEAVKIYDRLVAVEQDALWARRARQEALDGSLADGAKALTDLGEICLAEQRYLSLISSTEFSSDYYLQLGDLYIAQEHFNKGLWTYHQGLLVDENSHGLWRAMAKTYLTLRHIPSSIFIYNCLLADNPEDASSWAGLGRAFALMGCMKTAFRYYGYALYLDPENEDALSFMAQGEMERERYRSARNIYQTLSSIKPEKIWIQRQLVAAHKKTRPFANFEANYHEEDEWNGGVNDWVARYQVYGGGVRMTAPINDFFRMAGYGRLDYYRLVNVEQDFTIYDFNVVRGGLETRRAYGCNCFLELDLGASVYGPQECASFHQRSGIIIEPTVLYSWVQPDRRALFGFDTETNLVGREFEENKAKLVPRYFLTGSYEQDLYETVTLGINGALSYLNGFQANYLQQGMLVADWRPQAFRKCFSFRYFFLLQNFNKVIPEYYTYAPQLKNQLQVEYRMKIRDEGTIQLGYAFGFQDSRTRFAQIIVNAPLEIGPIFWDRRRYNLGYLKASYDQCPFKISVEGNFYRDTERYTMWDLNLNIERLF
ncbi:MAG: tetratricopeptide repeat protein, partial [Chlamydiia bacterium]|nr:tetratricopeptide repeat protein [Chlamydiia bacterium]